MNGMVLSALGEGVRKQSGDSGRWGLESLGAHFGLWNVVTFVTFWAGWGVLSEQHWNEYKMGKTTALWISKRVSLSLLFPRPSGPTWCVMHEKLDWWLMFFSIYVESCLCIIMKHLSDSWTMVEINHPCNSPNTQRSQMCCYNYELFL